AATALASHDLPHPLAPITNTACALIDRTSVSHHTASSPNNATSTAARTSSSSAQHSTVWSTKRPRSSSPSPSHSYCSVVSTPLISKIEIVPRRSITQRASNRSRNNSNSNSRRSSPHRTRTRRQAHSVDSTSGCTLAIASSFNANHCACVALTNTSAT